MSRASTMRVISGSLQLAMRRPARVDGDLFAAAGSGPSMDRKLLEAMTLQ